MNRRRRIIVSITGITIILLALLGITYGYYLTNIVGNTNSNSISITTNKLSLEYAEDEDSNITLDKAEPGAKASKEFYVTNTGNDTVYDYGVFLEDVINTFNRTEDIVYTLTCEIQKNGVKTGECNGTSGIYPTANTMLVKNNIEKDTTHVYTLEIEYKYLDTIDQSEDMGKSLGGKVQIYALSDVIAVTGTVTGYATGDYIQIESDPKVSMIDENGKYNLVGIMPGNHTLKVIDSNGSEKLTKTLTIKKSNEASVNDNIITINDDSETINVDINIDTQKYTFSNILDYTPNNGILALSYTNGSKVNITTSESIDDSEIKTNAIEYPFSITNVSEEHQKITIKLTNIQMDDTLKDIDFRWGLYNADTNKGISFGVFKYVGDEEVIYADTIIDAATPDITKNYILRIWVHNNGTTQSDLLNKKFSAKINVESNPIEYTDASCFTMDYTDIIGYDESCGTDVVVPRTINGSSVTLIGMQVFADQYGTPKISSVILPSSIQYILGANFSGYSSEYFFLPENVTTISNGSGTGMGTFEGAAIKKMYLPEGLNSITQYTFMGSQIEEMVIPGNLSTLPENSISSRNLKSLVLMNGVTSIGSSNIISSQLKTLEIPSSVNTISNSAISEFDADLDNIIVRGKSSINDFTGDVSGLSGLGIVNIIYRQN